MIPAEDPPHALSLSHARGRAPAMPTSTRLGSRSPRHKPPSSSGVLDERAHAPVGSVWIDMVIRGKSLHSAGPKPSRSDDRSARRAQAPSTHQPPHARSAAGGRAGRRTRAAGSRTGPQPRGCEAATHATQPEGEATFHAHHHPLPATLSGRCAIIHATDSPPALSLSHARGRAHAMLTST